MGFKINMHSLPRLFFGGLATQGQTHKSAQTGDPYYQNFYESFAGRSLDYFHQVEIALYENSTGLAETLISSITPTNSVELYYKNYFELYMGYSSDEFDPSGGTESTLIDLCTLCPERYGAYVYKARALYNTVYRTAKIFPDNCEDFGARKGRSPKDADIQSDWEVKLYPNPTANRLNVVSNQQNEELEIEIKDLSGRVLFKQLIKTKDFLVTLDLTLINGVYLVNIENGAHRKLVKKLLISK